MLARQIAIGFGVAIIFPLLIYYGVRTFQAPPVWNTIVTVSARPLADVQTNPEERQAIQEKRREQEQTFNAAAKDFARILVLVSTPLGIAGILAGAYLANVAIGTGLILGGILTIAHGYWGYWNYADDWLRFVSLLVALVVLVFVGYRRYGST
jgi:uncharacterized membrane protein YphA (DoxX/SURF4 family)